MAVERRLKTPRDVVDLIRGLHPGLKSKVRAALEAILASRDSGKPLKDDLAGLYSFRTGKFRIIYRPVGKIVEIIAVGPRRTIYEETWRRIRPR